MADIDVIVCGAGIGGLCTAAALRQRGIRTTVLEQAPEMGEIGAGLQLGPNATRVLYALGLAEALADVTLVVQETINRRWQDGSIIAKTTLGASAIERYGAPYLQVHRADLHRVLLDAATSPGAPGEPVATMTDSRVVGVDESDPLRPAALLDDGRRVEASVIVGADGVRSVVRNHIGAPAGVSDSGDMAYRTLIDGEAVRRDPATRFLMDWQAGHVWFGHDQHVVVYPVRNFSQVNIVGITAVTDEVSKDWSRPATQAELLNAYAGWDERLLRLLAMPSSPIIAWALKHQEPFSDWSRGNLTLVGDASHSMVPYVSQGASQAIEDGAVLAEELADSTPETVAARLRSYAERRADRAAAVQVAAMDNRGVFHLPDGEAQRARDESMRSESKNVNSKLDWIYAGTPPRGSAPLSA